MLLCSLAHNVGFEAEDVAGADLEAVGDPEGVEVDGKSQAGVGAYSAGAPYSWVSSNHLNFPPNCLELAL